jgi:hypothetical protein
MALTIDRFERTLDNRNVSAKFSRDRHSNWLRSLGRLVGGSRNRRRHSELLGQFHGDDHMGGSHVGYCLRPSRVAFR